MGRLDRGEAGPKALLDGRGDLEDDDVLNDDAGGGDGETSERSWAAGWGPKPDLSHPTPHRMVARACQLSGSCGYRAASSAVTARLARMVKWIQPPQWGQRPTNPVSSHQGAPRGRERSVRGLPGGNRWPASVAHNRREGRRHPGTRYEVPSNAPGRLVGRGRASGPIPQQPERSIRWTPWPSPTSHPSNSTWTPRTEHLMNIIPGIGRD